MYIIGGRFKGKRLQFPKDRDFRPTQQRVRESLFNIIQTRVQGAHFLDLCAGTGANGLEAYSRGAAEVTFIELKSKFLDENIDLVVPKDERDKITVYNRPLPNGLQLIKPKSMDLIFLDPPWDATEVYEATLKAIFQFDILSPTGCLIVEHKRRAKIRELLPEGRVSQYQYSDTELTVFYEQ
jgi:16S rRNA (guanine966-N2)-methyltransferase